MVALSLEAKIRAFQVSYSERDATLRKRAAYRGGQ